MNRLTFLLISATFIILTTLVVNSLGIGTQAEEIGQMPADVDNNVGSVMSIVGTFVDLLTFQLGDSIPIMFNIVFSVIAIGMGYIIIMIIKDVVPFT